MTKRKILISIGIILALGAGLVIGYMALQALDASSPSPKKSPASQPTPRPSEPKKPTEISVVANNLNTPWSIEFLPNDDMLVSERGGTVKRIGKNGASYTIKNVQETSEGGLLGIALHPEFKTNKTLYLYYSTSSKNKLKNRIDRAELADDTLKNQRTILDNIPAAQYHNGGALAFGPDKKLYVTTGDAKQPALAQDTTSLAGKILRLNDDGTAADGNPFDNRTWSYGHRNPQGIAWDEDEQLWEVEHGPTASDVGQDEVNKIEKGANYGWPHITGSQTRKGMKAPVVQSGRDTTWAPSRLAIHKGTLYFTGLKGQALYSYDTTAKKPTVKAHFHKKYGRLRAVTIHDGVLYMSTSNRDGRGSPQKGDDKILEVPLQKIE